MKKINVVLFLFIIAFFACSKERGEDIETPPEKKPDTPYKTVKMDSQIWFAENSNEKPSSGNSWCYGNYPPNCDKYGKLYDWTAANSACPSGWKLPSKDDYDKLLDYVENGKDGTFAGTALKNEKGWNAIFGGYKSEESGFVSLDEQAFLWSSTESGSSDAYYRSIKKDSQYLQSGPDKKTKGYSVRCIMI
jgi:uncharacterized protein (TIGR02145 family)